MFHKVFHCNVSRNLNNYSLQIQCIHVLCQNIYINTPLFFWPIFSTSCSSFCSHKVKFSDLLVDCELNKDTLDFVNLETISEVFQKKCQTKTERYNLGCSSFHTVAYISAVALGFYPTLFYEDRSGVNKALVYNCVRSVQSWRFFSYSFSHIRAEYGDLI